MDDRYELYYEKGYHTLYDRHFNQVIALSDQPLQHEHIIDVIKHYEKNNRRTGRSND